MQPAKEPLHDPIRQKGLISYRCVPGLLRGNLLRLGNGRPWRESEDEQLQGVSVIQSELLRGTGMLRIKGRNLGNGYIESGTLYSVVTGIAGIYIYIYGGIYVACLPYIISNTEYQISKQCVDSCVASF